MQLYVEKIWTFYPITIEPKINSNGSIQIFIFCWLQIKGFAKCPILLLLQNRTVWYVSILNVRNWYLYTWKLFIGLFVSGDIYFILKEKDQRGFHTIILWGLGVPNTYLHNMNNLSRQSDRICKVKGVQFVQSNCYDFFGTNETYFWSKMVWEGKYNFYDW